MARKRHIRPFRPRFGGFESLLPQQGVFAALRASVPKQSAALAANRSESTQKRCNAACQALQNMV
nr:MAG TPA: hypothetical protein [Caudoviricetes sp.]